MNTKITLTTERLLLQPLSESDSALILVLLNTEGWIKFIGNRNINSDEDAIAYIQKINSRENTTYWTVKIKDTDTAIGLVTLIKRDYLDHTDIGFAFLPNYFGKGYAYEGANAVLHYLARNNFITHILAETLPENIGSIKLIEKLGLQFEKVMEIDNETLHIYKAPADSLI
jgi:[ribosomal protein S5]-alanine N-acetyltransferase